MQAVRDLSAINQIFFRNKIKKLVALERTIIHLNRIPANVDGTMEALTEICVGQTVLCNAIRN